MARNWFLFYGGYAGTDGIPDVVLGGSPNPQDNRLFGVDLAKAHALGKGQGIWTEYDEQTKVLNFGFSLVPFAVSSSNTWVKANTYVTNSGTYRYYFTFEEDNGNGFENKAGRKMFSQDWSSNLYDTDGFINSVLEYSNSLSLAIRPNLKRIRFKIYGEDATRPYEHIYTVEELKYGLDSYPYAQRKSGVFVSFMRSNKKMRIRKSGVFNVLTTEKNKIRKGNTWINQKRVGDL